MKIPIHTTLSPKARQYLQYIQDVNNCNLNKAIEITIDRNQICDKKIKGKILDEVINEVLRRYLSKTDE